jgi:hypothetical protein
MVSYVGEARIPPTLQIAQMAKIAKITIRVAIFFFILLQQPK